jgi:hypothetical protein
VKTGRIRFGWRIFAGNEQVYANTESLTHGDE